jgi:hypothetical protein
MKKVTKRRLIQFNINFDIDNNVLKSVDELNLKFSSILLTKSPDFIKYTPYEVNILELVPKNEWTKGHYVAVEKDDGTLDFSLNFQKISELKKFPTDKLVWVLFHEFRHKIQISDEQIKSVIDYPNWKKFKDYMIKITGKDEDLINHIFHEINPAEVDAHIFACQMTGMKFTGTSFDITDEKLRMLQSK